jgi:ELMO/CED-12 family
MQANRQNHDDEEVGLLGHHQDDLDQVTNHSEPVSHIRNRKKGCIQLICPCIGPEPDGCELTQDESNHFGNTQKKMNVLYDKTNTKHENKLKDLYDNFVAPAQPPADPITLKTKAWGDLGFQGEDPRTDFRGGGYSSLCVIYNFCHSHTELLPRVKAENEKGNILFACSSINGTFFLKNYFHMGDMAVIAPEKRQSELASRVALKSFCGWLAKEHRVIQRLHDILFIRLFELWSQACVKNPALTIMDLGSAEKMVREDFKTIINSRHFGSVLSLEEALRSSRLDPGKVTKFTF